MNVLQFPRMVVSSREGWDTVERLRPPMDQVFLRLVLPLSLLPPLMITEEDCSWIEKSFDDDTGASWPERSVEIYWRTYDGHEPITPDPRGDHGDPHMQRNVAACEAIKREIAAAAVTA